MSYIKYMFNNVFNKRSAYKISLVSGIGLFAFFAVASFILPRKINVSRAESCSPVYQQPVFNPYPVTFQDPPEDCKDYPTVEARLSTGTYPHSAAELAAGVTAHAGDQVNVLIYFHNGASENLNPSQTTITNFKISTTVDTTDGTTHNVGATLSGTGVNSLSGTTTIHTGANEKLEIVAGSGVLYDFQSNPVQGAFDVGNNTLNLQDLLACFSHSGFVRFTVRVVATTPTTVDNAVCVNASNIPATLPGQPFSASVGLQNTGTSTWRNADRYVLKVNSSSNLGLPDQLEIPNATTIPPNSQRLFNLNGTAPQTSGTYNFSVQMAKSGAVFGAVCPFALIVGQATPVTLTIDKQVRNVTTGTGFSPSTNAQNGNTVEYKIVVTAHGGTSHNTTVTDNFPSGLTYVNGSLTVNGQPHATGLTNGINFGDLPDGQSLTIVYRATINSGPASIVNTATAHGSNTNTVQDQATVVVTQINHTAPVCNPANQTVLVGQTAFFNATAGNGSYSWSANGGNPSSGNGSSFSTSYSTTGSKTVIVTSDGLTDTCNVQVNPIVNPVVVCSPGNQTVDVNQVAYFNATGGNGTFTWSAPGGSPSNGSSANFSTRYSTSGSKTVTVTSNGTSDTCNVQVNPIIHPVVCNPGSQVVNVDQVAYFNASSGNGTFTWSAPGASPSSGTGANFSASYHTSGNKVVTVTSNGTSDTCNVQVNPVFQAVVCNPGNQTVDVNQVAYFNVTGGNGTFSWSTPGGSPATGSGNSFSTAYARVGNKVVTVTSNGQSDTCNVQVARAEHAVVCSPSNQNANVGQLVYFTASGGTGAFSWSAPDGNPSSGSGSSFTTSYSNSGGKTVIVNSGGVSASCNVQIAQIITPAVVCTPSMQNINVGQVAYFNATGGNGSYSWSAYAGNPSSGNGSSFSTSYFTPGTQSVIVSSGGSSAVCNVQVGQIISPVTCNPNNQTVNVNQQAYFTANGGNGSFNWYATDGNPSSGSGPSFGTFYSTTGSRVVIVSSGNNSASCTVNVNGNVLGTSTNLNYSKKAWNDTKNNDATTIRASKGDSITYTLTVTNTGSAPAQNFVISDDLSQVLDKADIIDNGGGSVSGNVITFPGVTVPAGGSVSKSFRVQIKTSLANNQTYILSNAYGNTVNITVGTPQVLGAFVAPTTGASGMSAAAFAGLATLSFALYMKRKTLLSLILN